MNAYVQAREPKQSNFVLATIRDAATVVSLGIFLACVHYLGRPFIRGFTCNDDTIRYPFKDSTISSSLCYFAGSGINVLLILVLEAQDTLLRKPEELDESRPNARIRVYSKNVYCRLTVWFFGSLVSEILTDISKFTAGRLRPHFIGVCKPRIDGTVYDQYSIVEYCRSHDPYEYITNYECAGEPSRQRDIRLSFLSGHSSYSAYSAAFAVIYIQSALDTAKYGLIKPAIQVLIIAAAFYTGLTRVSDYKHHWQDVLAGFLLGTSVAIVVSKFVGTTLRKAYAKFIKPLNTRPQVAQSGEELAHAKDMSQSIVYIIVAAAVLLATLEQASCVNPLSKKLRGLVDRRKPGHNRFGYMQHYPAYYGGGGGHVGGHGGHGGHNNGGSASAAAAASGGGSAAAAAAASNGGHSDHYGGGYLGEQIMEPYEQQYMEPHYGHNAHYGQTVGGYQAFEPQYYMRPEHNHHHHHLHRPHLSGGGSSSAAAAASAASNAANIYDEAASVPIPVAVPAPQHYAPMHVARPMPRYTAAPMNVGHVAPVNHGSSSAAAAAASSAGGASAAAAAASSSGGHGHMHGHGHMGPVGYEGLNQRLVEDDHVHSSYHPEEQVYSAATGTYAGDGLGHESSSYVRNTENLVNHEDGREDDNHYYQAQSYGKATDVNKHEAYNNADEDIMQTGQMFRKKKTSTNWVSDYNKNHRESGSGVLAKDQHSSAYNKDHHRFVENVDKRHNMNGMGGVGSTSAVTSNSFDDEDESYFDSDGMHGHRRFVPPHHGRGGAAASSAVGGGLGGSVATSASVGGGASSSVAGK